MLLVGGGCRRNIDEAVRHRCSKEAELTCAMHSGVCYSSTSLSKYDGCHSYAVSKLSMARQAKKELLSELKSFLSKQMTVVAGWQSVRQYYRHTTGKRCRGQWFLGQFPNIARANNRNERHECIFSIHSWHMLATAEALQESASI